MSERTNIRRGAGLEVGDVIVVLGESRRITHFDDYDGELDLPAGTRIARSNEWGVTVMPDSGVWVVDEGPAETQHPPKGCSPGHTMCGPLCPASTHECGCGSTDHAPAACPDAALPAESTPEPQTRVPAHEEA